jgi:hypothetical protein
MSEVNLDLVGWCCVMAYHHGPAGDLRAAPFFGKVDAGSFLDGYT